MIAHLYTRSTAPRSTIRLVTESEIRGTSLDVNSQDLIWADIVDPRQQDIDWLQRTFGFHRLALEDVARLHQRPKLDEYDGYYFGVIYAAHVDKGHHSVRTAELQFFWGRTYLVTIHAERSAELEDLASRARAGQVAPVVGGDDHTLQVADLAYRILDGIVDGYFPVVDALAEWTEQIEERMFARKHSQAVLQRIFLLRKNLIHLRKVVAPSREILNVLLRRDVQLFTNEFDPYFQDVYDHTIRVIDTLDTYRDLLTSAVDTYLSIVSNDVNQTVKRMTAVTAILMVDALVAGIYGMNFDNIPELHWAFGYAYALVLMLACTLGLWVLFKRIEWF